MTASLLLHIGPHKTATSLIQHAVARNKQRLSDVGVEIASTGLIGVGHHDLAFALLSGNRQVNLATIGRTMPKWSDLAEELGSAPDRQRLFVTSENFSLVNADEFDEASTALQSIDVSIIAGLRDPLDAVTSLWQEGVKWSRQWTLEEGAARLLQDPRITLIPLLEQWSRATCARAIQLVVVPSRPDAQATVRNLESAIGVPANTIMADGFGAVNASLSACHAEAIRAVSISMDPTDSRATLVERQRVTQRLSVLVPQGVPSASSKLPEPLIEKALQLRERVLRQVSESGASVNGALEEYFSSPAPPSPPPTRADITRALEAMAEQDLAAGASCQRELQDCLDSFAEPTSRKSHRRRWRWFRSNP
jgi:hypothetical protein